MENVRHEELFLRKLSARYIQDIGEILQLTQQCINTAIIYMHVFYIHHTFVLYKYEDLGVVTIYLAAKVEEEQPKRFLESVIRASMKQNPGIMVSNIDAKDERYIRYREKLLNIEIMLLIAINFQCNVVHPHTHIKKGCQLINAPIELKGACLYLANKFLQSTIMCLKYTPELLACACIKLACEWMDYRIIPLSDDQNWFSHIDPETTMDKIMSIKNEFLNTYKIIRKIENTHDKV